jgi:hypothetical protein
VPYQADYVLRLIEQLSGMVRGLKQRLGGPQPEEPQEVAGQAFGLVLGMDPLVAVRLSPSTLTAMLRLGAVSPEVLAILAEAVELEAQILARAGRSDEAETRRAQAAAVRSAM